MGNVRTKTEALALKLAKVPLGPMLAERGSILFKSNQSEEGAIRFDMKLHTGPLVGFFEISPSALSLARVIIARSYTANSKVPHKSAASVQTRRDARKTSPDGL